MVFQDAKDYFSRRNCVAEQKAAKYLKGSPIRQEYLETVLCWISNGKIEEYMGKHQHEKDADELRQYFVKVIDWVERTFITYRKEMAGLEWGELYNVYHSNQYNTNDLEKEISQLMADEEVENKRGVYEYVLSKGTLSKCLSLRSFDEKIQATAFERQMKSGTGQATCPMCNDDTKLYSREEMEADHIVPWSKGGKTTLENCQILCKRHNQLKSSH